MEKYWSRFCWWLSSHLPNELVLYCYIRVIAYATSTVYTDKSPDEITYEMGYKAWENKK